MTNREPWRVSTKNGLDSLIRPATVSDRGDPRLVHLDGLNLNRAWCMKSIAGDLPAADPARAILTEAATRHAADALAHVANRECAGEHWLDLSRSICSPRPTRHSNRPICPGDQANSETLLRAKLCECSSDCRTN